MLNKWYEHEVYGDVKVVLHGLLYGQKTRQTSNFQRYSL